MQMLRNTTHKCLPYSQTPQAFDVMLLQAQQAALTTLKSVEHTPHLLLHNLKKGLQRGRNSIENDLRLVVMHPLNKVQA